MARKRKHSADESEDDNTPNKKAAKKESDEAKADIKSKLALFAHKDQENAGNEEQLNEVNSKSKKGKKNVKPKKEKKTDKEETSENANDNASEKKDVSKFQGLLKMPFKKSKKSKDKEGVSNQDEDSVDLELVLESSAEDVEKSGNLNITEGKVSLYHIFYLLIFKFRCQYQQHDR